MIQVLSRREGFTTDDSCVRSKKLGVCHKDSPRSQNVSVFICASHLHTTVLKL